MSSWGTIAKKSLKSLDSEEVVLDISDTDSDDDTFAPKSKKSKPMSAPVAKESRPTASDLFDSFLSSDVSGTSADKAAEKGDRG